MVEEKYRTFLIEHVAASQVRHSGRDCWVVHERKFVTRSTVPWL
jgi:hypothetical protein